MCMKKTFIICLFNLCVGMLMMSCEGPPGIDGKDGANGSDGQDGVDGNLVCMQCHTLNYKSEVTDQYQFSKHFTGITYQSRGSSKTCAKCHSHEGFVETLFTGRDTTANNVPIPTLFGCTTCHESHRTFDFTNDGPDYALRTIAPIKLQAYGGQTLDLGGSNNLCGYCHQPRTAAPVDDGTGNAYMSSTNYGPHHAPSGTVLYGMGGYEFAGSEAYPAKGSGAHFSSSCTGCHMGAFDGTAGGHTLIPSEASCKKCHTGSIPSIEAEMNGLIATLTTILEAKGAWANDRPVKGTFPVDVVGAVYNLRLIKEDLSLGIHNPRYTKALLKNTIAAMQ